MSLLEDERLIEVEPDLAGRVVVRVHGALDLLEAGDLRAVLTQVCEGDCPAVVVDLSDVSFLGSSSMGVLLQARNDLDSCGRSLVVRGASPSIRRAFAITQLDQLLDFEDVEDAPQS